MTDDEKALPKKKIIRRIRLRDRNDDREVGYGKPPKAHRFKPGQSGNPSGRPRNKKTLATITQELLDKTVSIIERGKVKRISMKDALMRRILDDALKGNIKSANFLFGLYHTASAGHSVDDLSENEKAILEAFVSELKADLVRTP